MSRFQWNQGYIYLYILKYCLLYHSWFSYTEGNWDMKYHYYKIDLVNLTMCCTQIFSIFVHVFIHLHLKEINGSISTTVPVFNRWNDPVYNWSSPLTTFDLFVLVGGAVLFPLDHLCGTNSVNIWAEDWLGGWKQLIGFIPNRELVRKVAVMECFDPSCFVFPLTVSVLFSQCSRHWGIHAMSV